MTMAQAQVDLQARDLTILETCLPAHMLFLMAEQCQKAGLEFRADVAHKLNVAAVAPLSRIDTLSVARLSKRVDETARSLLHDLSPDDPRDGLYTVCQFILKIVDEGRFTDPRNMAVLIALLLMDDLKDERPDVEGQGAVWRVEEARWREKAGRMLSRANLLGFYSLPLCN